MFVYVKIRFKSIDLQYILNSLDVWTHGKHARKFSKEEPVLTLILRMCCIC